MVRFFVALILAGFAVAESQAQVASVTSSPTSSASPQTSPSASTQCQPV